MADEYIDIYVDSATGNEYTIDDLPDHLRSKLDQAREPTDFLSDAKNSIKSSYYGLASNLVGGLGEFVGDGIQAAAPFGYYAQNSFRPFSGLSDGPSEESRQFYENVANFGQGLSSKSKEFRDIYAQEAASAKNEIVQDPDSSFYNFAINALPGVSKVAGAAIPAIVAKNPQLLGPSMTGLFVGEGLGADYTQGKDAGLDKATSLGLAAERAIPNYIQSKVMDPLTPTGGIKGVFGQSINNALSSGLDLLNRAVTDQTIVEGKDLNIPDVFDAATENFQKGIPEMVGMQFASQLAGRAAMSRQNKANNSLVKQLEGTITPLEDPSTNTVDSQVQDAVVPLDDPAPIAVKTKIDQTQIDKAQPVPIDKSQVEESQTKIKTEAEVIREAEADVPMGKDIEELFALVDENENPTIVPEEAQVLAEKAINKKTDEITEFQDKVSKVSETIRPLVERQLLDPDRALAVTEEISEVKFGPDARKLQLDFIQKANVEGLSTESIRTLANETSNLHQVTKALELKTEPVDLLNKLETYRKELQGFEDKIGDARNPWKANLNTNKLKKYIGDEVAQSLDPYNDPDFFRALDAADNDPKIIRKLVKDRILAKEQGSIKLYKDDDTPSFIETISSEKGAVNPDLFGFNVYKGATEKIKKNLFQSSSLDDAQLSMLADIEQRVQDEIGTILPGKDIPNIRYDIDRFLQGEIASLDIIPGWNQIPDAVKYPITESLKLTRKWYTQPKKIADLDVEGGDLRKAYDRVHTKEMMKSIVRTTALEKLTPYSDLIDKSRVNKILIMRTDKAQDAYQQGKKLSFTDEDYAKVGATAEDKAAIKAWDETTGMMWKVVGSQMRKIVSDRIPEGPDRLAKLRQVDDWLRAKELTYYVPETRTGKYAVYGSHGQSDAIPPFYGRYDSLAKAKQISEGLKKSGYNVKEPYVWRPPTDSAYAAMPDDLLLDLNAILEPGGDEGRGTTIQGFKSHLLKRGDVLGAPTDLFKQIVKYVDSASSAAMEWKYDQKIKSLLNQDKYERSEGAEYLRKWYDYTKKNTNEGRLIRHLISQHTLGFLQPSSAVINLISPLTATAPELSKVLSGPPGKAYWEITKAQKVSAEYLAFPGSFKKKNPQLYAALKREEKSGAMGSGKLGFLGGDEQGSIGSLAKTGVQKLSDLGMILQRFSEANNRYVSFISAYNNAPKGQNKARFAQDFNNKVNGDYSKLNRPKRAQGALGATTYVMKLYGHNYLSNVLETVRAVAGGAKDTVVKRDMASLKKFGKNLESLTLYGLPLAATGGVLSLPMATDIVNIGGALGYDVMTDLEKSIEDPSLASDIVHGIPLRTFGFSVRGALGNSVGLDIENTLLESVGSAMIGLPYELAYNKPRRAMESWKSGAKTKAIETLLPRGVARPYESYQANKDFRGFTNSFGDSISIMGEKPSQTDLYLNAAGFQPESKVRPRQMTNSMKLLTRADQGKTEGLNNRIKNRYADVINANMNGDEEGAKEAIAALMEEARSSIEKGVEPERVIEKVIGPEAMDGLKKMTSAAYREISKARKPVREEMMKLLIEDQKRKDLGLTR
jgi:hypothetical protein